MSATAEVLLAIWININILIVVIRVQLYHRYLKQKLGSNRANGLPSV